MFRHLLLPLTGTGLDAEAVRHARAMALLAGADVHVMRVLEPPERGPDAGPIDTLEWHARRVAAEEGLARVADELRAAGLTVETTCAEGQVTEHIIHQVHRGVDLMVLPTGEFGRAHVGALGGQVLWRSYVTTLLVRGERAPDHGRRDGPTTRQAAKVVPRGWTGETAPAETSAETAGEPAAGTAAEAAGGEPGAATAATPTDTDTEADATREADAARPAGEARSLYHTVLVGLDGSRRAECVLPVVRFLATAVASKVVLAHVIEEPALPRLVPPTPEETALVEHLMAVNESAAGDYLADVEARIGVSTETRLKRGKSTVSALHAMVDESGADLVILSAHGYGGDQTWPYGEVATNLIGYGRTPLLVVHDVPWTERTAPAADVTDEAWGR